ncbi:hypothetical protein M405DRAFT_96662 [Rhizopogon salebrosus TDB-379]|nr:hypothetical protein M405DRAFT_96662 [Rhizopogon salebrosus TDB-379]
MAQHIQQNQHVTTMSHASPASHEGVADNHETPHETPGAYLFPFGSFAGKRLDTIPTNLRWWATQPKCKDNSWYAACVAANERYEEFLLETPEAYPFPRGEGEGKRLDEVREDLLWWTIHPSNSSEHWYQNLVEATRRYLDKVYETKSPGSVEIWFGSKYRGYRLDDVYKRRRFINWCLDPARQGCRWYYRFEDLVRRYEVHRQTHRREYHKRRPPHVQNPTGELLGKWDDGRGSVEPGDDYERDGFIVDDEDTWEEEGSDSEFGDSTDDPTADDDGQDEEEHSDSEFKEDADTDKSVSRAEWLLPSRAGADASRSSESGTDSDDDMPLDDLQGKTMCLFKGSKAKVVSSSNRRRSLGSLSEDSDTTAKPPLKRLKRRSEQGAKTDPHFDAKSCDARLHLDEPDSPQRNQLSQSVRSLSLSQEPATSTNRTNVDELPRAPSKSVQADDDETSASDSYTNALTHLGKRYRVVIDSDEEGS